jgi:hypothetical protein
MTPELAQSVLAAKWQIKLGALSRLKAFAQAVLDGRIVSLDARKYQEIARKAALWDLRRSMRKAERERACAPAPTRS